MRKLYLAVALLCAIVSPAFAQYTNVAATGITVDNGSGTAINPPSGSTLCFQGTNGAGTNITYTPEGGSPVTGPVCQTFGSGGNLSGSFQVADQSVATPIGLRYTITIANGATTYLVLPLVQVSGPLFTFTNYAIPGNGTVSGLGYPHIGCNFGAQWTSTTISPGASTCEDVSGIGTWLGFPTSPYCPAGMGYIVPQVSGNPFCISPTITGLGAPSGVCLKNAIYFQQDASAGQYFWGCVSGTWEQLTGSGSGGGLTSFNGRTTPAATLQTSDLTALLANSPFSLTASGELLFASGSGTFTGDAAWTVNGSGLYGNTATLYLNNGSATTVQINGSDGSASFGNGFFAVSPSTGVQWGGGDPIVSSNQVCLISGTNCPPGATTYYQSVQNNATSPLTPRQKTNYIGITGISAADNGSNGSTDISLNAIPNTSLANSGITINVSGSLTGGGTVALGGSISIVGTGGGGGGSPAGGNYAVQYDSGGAFAGANFTGLVMNNGSAAVPSAATAAQVTALVNSATASTLGLVQLATGQTSTTLSTVATTGVYSDLTGRPTFGTAAALNTGTSGGTICVINTSCSWAAQTFSGVTDSALTPGDLVSVGAGGLLGNGPAVSNVPLLNASNVFTAAQGVNLAGTGNATMLDLLEPSLATGNYNSILLGAANSSYNEAQMSFVKAGGTGSVSNYLGLGLAGGYIDSIDGNGTFSAVGGGPVAVRLLPTPASGTYTVQGPTISWNIQSGLGETDFVNEHGAGTGGFNFYDVAPGGTPTTAILNIDASGNTTANGALIQVGGPLGAYPAGTSIVTNVSGVFGETDFVNNNNHNPGFSNAFEWYGYYPSGPFPGLNTALMALSQDGELQVASSMFVNNTPPGLGTPQDVNAIINISNSAGSTLWTVQPGAAPSGTTLCSRGSIWSNNGSGGSSFYGCNASHVWVSIVP